MSVTSTFNSAFDSLKNFWQQFDLKKWAENIGGSSAQAIQAAVYFALSFAIGFLFKKYFRFLFMSCVGAVFIILFLHYNKLVVVDLKAIKAMVGIGDGVPSGDMNVIINRFFDWVRDNMLFFISSIVGFVIGYKLG
jgi:hypothetical protein